MSVYAANQNSGTTVGSQGVGQATMVQDDNVQVQTVSPGQGAPANPNVNQQQIQQRLQDGSEAGQQVQGQNQMNNQNNENQIQNNQQEQLQAESGNGSENSQQRRSQVANAVQEMLNIANIMSGGIGEQVRTIAQTQNQNQERLEVSLEKIQSRAGIVKFLIGSNYGEIKTVRQTLEQNREQIQQLNQIRTQIEDEGGQQLLSEQIAVLEQTNTEIEAFINDSESTFSLLGWMFKLFSK